MNAGLIGQTGTLGPNQVCGFDLTLTGPILEFLVQWVWVEPVDDTPSEVQVMEHLERPPELHRKCWVLGQMDQEERAADSKARKWNSVTFRKLGGSRGAN